MSIVSPAASLMNKLSYPRKMILISTIFIIPLMTSLYMLNGQLNININFAEKERLGVEYIQQLRKLTEHIPAHRGMTNAYLAGDESFQSKIMAKRTEINADITAIDEVDAKLGEILETGKQWPAIKSEWSRVMNMNSGQHSAKEVFAAHSNLIANVIGLISHVGDTSNLILDPDLDSYYLMDAVVNKLLHVSENLGQARGAGAGIAARGTMTLDERINLTILANSAQENLDATMSGMQVAFRENPTLIPTLKADLDKGVQKVNDFLTMLNKELIKQENITLPPQALFTLGSSAISANYQLYDNIAPQLDTLLELRSDGYRNDKYILFAKVFILMAIAIYLFFGFYSSIHKAVLELKSASTKLAGGDLTARAKKESKDELGEVVDAFNTVGEQFQLVIKQIIQSTQSFSASTSQLQNVTMQTSAGASEQQLQTDQVVSAVTEMAATVQEVARSAENAADAARIADERVKEGNQIVAETISSINDLSREVEGAADVIHGLETESQEIGSVLDVIRDIAEQTNLLALNAAIEAARAGEQGRGFAVVADEVRTLASRTQTSTQEIQSMIERIQQSAGNAVSTMESGRTQTQASVEKATKAGHALEAINESVGTISDMNAQIASAAEEQSAVAEEINRNMVEIRQITEQTATGAKQTASGSEELANAANQLGNMVKRFTL